jgi:hypothetical protein
MLLSIFCVATIAEFCCCNISDKVSSDVYFDTIAQFFCSSEVSNDVSGEIGFCDNSKIFLL